MLLSNLWENNTYRDSDESKYSFEFSWQMVSNQFTAFDVYNT